MGEEEFPFDNDDLKGLPHSGDVILQASDIYKSYTTGKIVLPVLLGIDLEVKRGEILTIVGPSGVGKSTLLHILGALDRPTQGRVMFNSKDVFSLPDEELARFRNKSIGFVFQFHHLLPEFTALENVMMPCLIDRQDRENALLKAWQLLQEVGLAGREFHRPGELSGGEQQRVALARALSNDPEIVLADEPSGNLDQHSAEALYDLIWGLNRSKGQTFLIVTHNEGLTTRAHRKFRLIDGRLRLEP